MGKLHKNSYGKIYSDFAGRLGRIVLQYEEIIVRQNYEFEIKEEEKFESTLYVCVLQSLSSQFRALTEGENPLRDSPLPFWGLDESQISKFPNNEEINLGRVIQYIRDTLSHPWTDNRFVYEDTNENGIITGYTFQKNKKFKITIPVNDLRTLISELSNFLKKQGGESNRDEKAIATIRKKELSR